jgi:hypothetical protein
MGEEQVGRGEGFKKVWEVEGGEDGEGDDERDENRWSGLGRGRDGDRMMER